MSQATIKDNNNSFNNTTNVNVWNNYTVADDRSQLLAWLSPLEPRLRHRDIQERRVDNVGGGLMQTEEFRSWNDGGGKGEGDNGVLFCYGAPGAGKTFISSLVVDTLCDRARGQNTAVACFYIDFVARKEQSATSMLGSLLKQIVSGMGRIPEEISQTFQEQNEVIGGRGPRLPDIVKMLLTITSSKRTFMCIDALDECAAAHRVKLLDSLKQILEKSPSTRIFVTGRPHIRAEIERRLAGRVISVPVGPSKDDITRFLRVRLDEDETPDAMDESLESEILRKIPENISEMFLLVSLSIEEILQESTIRRRREKLSKMTHGLGLADAYEVTIDRIKAQGGDKSRLGIAALMWVSHAERPLEADELCYALAVELGSTDFDATNIPSMSTLVSCCQGLITMDKATLTARLIHFTLQEYLSAHPNIFGGPDSTMAEICLTYLNSQQAKALPADSSPGLQDAPFLEYCSVYWGVHAKRELSDSATSLALKLFQQDYSRMSAISLLAQVRHVYDWSMASRSPFSGLHCASFFGISRVVTALIEMGCGNIDGGDPMGYTPLAWAAHNGHEELVSILLDQEGVNPEKEENYGQTPLSLAAWNGHEGVVKILLGREGVNPDKQNCAGRTPLLFAASEGREGVVKILVEQEGVNPDQPDKSGKTPLSFAAWDGHEGVVKILLEREGVNPDQPDDNGRTPLLFAAWEGHEGVMKTLLRREEVDPDKPDSEGRTPLSYAACCGREGAVKILLGLKGVNPDRPDTKGRTPLSYASSEGHEGVAKFLLGLEEVNPDKPDYDGRTPLSYATSRGVIALLQSHKVVPAVPSTI